MDKHKFISKLEKNKLKRNIKIKYKNEAHIIKKEKR